MNPRAKREPDGAAKHLQKSSPRIRLASDLIRQVRQVQLDGEKQRGIVAMNYRRQLDKRVARPIQYEGNGTSFEGAVRNVPQGFTVVFPYVLFTNMPGNPDPGGIFLSSQHRIEEIAGQDRWLALRLQ